MREGRLDPELAETALVPALLGQDVDVFVLDLETTIRVVLDERLTTEIVGNASCLPAIVGRDSPDEIVLLNPVRPAVVPREAPDESATNLSFTPVTTRH